MPSLALSMIVRDAQEDIIACLESVRGIVDEIVVADTGSKDGTPGIARQHGARVISIPWEEDFAQARNVALEAVSSDWVLVLDADEQLDRTGQHLRDLVAHTEFAGFQVPIRNYVSSLSERLWDRVAVPNTSMLERARKYPAYVEHENVRLFRRRPGIYFIGRVHESVGPRVIASGGKLGRADFFIHHFGLVADDETKNRKAKFYRELGRQKVQEMPGNAQAHFELGLVEFDNFQNYAEALECFERAIRINPRFPTARFFAGLALGQLGRDREALNYLKEAETLGHPSAIISEAKGDAYYRLGQFESARTCYRRALKQMPNSPDLEGKLGMVEVRTGQENAGLERLARAIDREPSATENYDRLLTLYVWLNRLLEAALVAEQKLQHTDPTPKDFLRAASIYARFQDWGKASEILERGLKQFPSASELRAAQSEIPVVSTNSARGTEVL